MRYYRQQTFFFLVILLLYLAFTQLLHQLAIYRIHQKEFSIFQHLIAERNKLLDGLEAKEYVKNYEKKLQAIEKVFYPYVKKISDILNEGQGWRGKITELELPLAKYSGIFIGRRNSAVLKLGQDFANIYGQDWEKGFFLGVNSEKVQFRNRVRLYPYPIEKEQFSIFKNQFQSIFKNNEFIHRYYAEKGGFSFLLLVHSNQLPEKELTAEIIRQYLEKYPNLELSKNSFDIYERDFYRQNLEKANCPFLWRGSHISYRNFIAGNYIFNLVYLLFTIMLWRMGGYQIIATRFEFRFFVLLFFFTYFIYVIILLRVENNIKNRETLHLKQVEQKWRQTLNHLEQELEVFLQKKAELLSDLFAQKRNPFRDQNWPSELTAIILRRAGFVQPYPEFKDMELFYNNLLLYMAPSLMGTQIIKAEKTKSENSISLVVARQKVQQDYGIEKYFIKSSHLIQPKSLSSDDMLVEIMGQLLEPAAQAKFSRFTLMQRESYVFWDISKTEPVEMLIAVIPTYQLHMEFIREYLTQQDTFRQPPEKNINISAHCFYEPDFFAQQGLSLSSEQINIYWDLLQKRAGLIRELEQQHIAFFELPSFPGFRYFFIEPAEYLSSEKQRRQYEIHIWLIFIYASLLAWLWRKMFNKIIKTIMTAFLNWRDEKYHERIEIKSQDFSARLFQTFNNFAHFYEQKTTLLPTINPIIAAIFAEQEKKLPLQFNGAVAIVYCFTPIKELKMATEQLEYWSEIQHQQRQLIDLWLEKTAKYHGLLLKNNLDETIVIFFARHNRFYQQNALQLALEMQSAIQTGIGVASGEFFLSLIGNENFTHWFYDGSVLHEVQELTRKAQSGRHSKIFVSPDIYQKCQFSFDFVPIEKDYETASYEAVS